MPVIYKSDFHKYIDKQDIRNLNKKRGSAIYLPNNFKEKQGEGLLENITSFINNNKDSISNITDISGKVADVGQKISSSTIGILKGIEEIKRLKQERELASQTKLSSKQPILKPELVKKIVGSGFKIIN